MTPIALVVSDVDGTLLTKEKVLTERAINSVRKLHDAGSALRSPRAGRPSACGF